MKQVIVIRKDLKMRRGKEISQGAHASMKCILNKVFVDSISDGKVLFEMNDQNIKKWLFDGKFTKVTLQVNSEEELIECYENASKLGLNVAMIEDLGLTEFNGVTTKTCIAIGPDDPEKIDKVTKKLKLR